MKICLENPSEMPLKIVFFQILSPYNSIYHILRKPRSSEFFISAPISCNICAKTTFWKKLQKNENRLLQQWLQKLPLSAAVVELKRRWTCCYKKLIKCTAASCFWFHKIISLHRIQNVLVQFLPCKWMCRSRAWEEIIGLPKNDENC